MSDPTSTDEVKPTPVGEFNYRPAVSVRSANQPQTELDDILGQLMTKTADASYGEWQVVGLPEAKQAILDWHNKQVEETKRAERRKGVRDGYNYALTYVDLATDLNDAYRRVSEGHKKAMERVDD